MSDENKDVKQSGDSSGTTNVANSAVDEKGVPWENRAKEFERKLQDLQAKYEELQSTSEEVPTPVESPTKEQLEEMTKQELLEFVRVGPKAFFDKVLSEKSYKEQLPQAGDWIKNQSGYIEEDQARLIQIEREHNLTGMPLSVAKTAWKILQAEKLEKEFQALRSNQTREDTVSNQKTEGTGKSIPAGTGKLKRSDVIKLLAEAQKSGDYVKSQECIGMLEDLRE